MGGAPITALLQHVAHEVGELLRCEASALRLEMEESTRAVILDALKAAVYSAVALLGILSLLAFLIIGLADIITNRTSPITGFWTSALIIGVLFTATGGFMAVHHGRGIGRQTIQGKDRLAAKIPTRLFTTGQHRLKSDSR
ncbi:MAG: phage holin family protein [Acidiferrobacter sp.]